MTIEELEKFIKQELEIIKNDLSYLKKEKERLEENLLKIWGRTGGDKWG